MDLAATKQMLIAENAELRVRLEEAEETLRAIRGGEVDALVVEGPSGAQIFALQGVDAESNRLRGEMLAQVGEAVVAVDGEQRVIYLNAAAELQYGVTASDMIGRFLTEIYECRWASPEDATTAASALRERGVWRGENIHVTRDGRELYVESGIATLRGPDGAPCGQVAVVRDIAERKQAESALQKHSEEIEVLIDALPAFVWICKDPECRVIIGNRLANELTRTPPGANVSQTAVAQGEAEYLLQLKEDGTEYRPDELPIQRAIASGQPVREVLIDFRFPDGLAVKVLGNAIPLLDEDGKARGAVAAFIDITERKRTEAALVEAREVAEAATRAKDRLLADQAFDLAATARLQQLSSRLHAIQTLPALLEEILGAVIELQGSDFGKLQLLNRETGLLEIAALRGFRQEYVDYLKQAHVGDAPAYERALRQRKQIIVEDVNADPYYAPLRKAAAQAGYRAVLATPLFDLANEPLGVLSVHFRQPHRPESRAMRITEIYSRQAADVIALKLSEQSLRKSLYQAEAATRAKDQFLAVLSHELRTPLTPVLMTVHTLSRRTDLPPKMKESLAMIRRNVELEARFIDDLLDLTRIAHGKIQILHEKVDVHEAIRNAVEISAPDMEARSQQFEMELDAARHQVLGDINRLQQVFWNLLKNASKFSPEGGEIHLRSYNESGRIVVVVTDSGIGMEPEVLQKVFHPFEQANESIARTFGGLGLGLAIARAVVEAHGGQISAASAGRDRGATFTVSLLPT